jgi:hypothetical protein
MNREQRIVAWDTGIRARWYRANDLIGFSGPPLTIDLVEEETEQNWRLLFEGTQACRITAEECHWPFGIRNLPEQGGFFEVLDSEWSRSLGKGEILFLEKSRHFIICCYDDIIEVVAWECQISKLDRTGYPDGHGRIRIDPSQVYQGPPPEGEDALSKLLRMRLASREQE